MANTSVNTDIYQKILLKDKKGKTKLAETYHFYDEDPYEEILKKPKKKKVQKPKEVVKKQYKLR